MQTTYENNYDDQIYKLGWHNVFFELSPYRFYIVSFLINQSTWSYNFIFEFGSWGPQSRLHMYSHLQVRFFVQNWEWAFNRIQSFSNELQSQPIRQKITNILVIKFTHNKDIKAGVSLN